MTTLSYGDHRTMQIDGITPPVDEPALASEDRVATRGATFIAVDLGGTHARVALMSVGRDGRPVVGFYETYRCADHASLVEVLEAFARTHAVQATHLVLACAGYLDDGVVINENLSWPVAIEPIKATGRFDSVSVLNDFEAFAHAVPHIDRAQAITVLAGVADLTGPVLVVGPGTGLGAALWLPGRPARVLHTEAGQIELAARPGMEQTLRAAFGPEGAYVPYEHVLSGPGLLRLYRTLGMVRGLPTELPDPESITTAALAGTDPLAVETVAWFGRWLGALCGDLAMSFGATGGVCLAGGFLARIARLLRDGPFVERFLDKGVMRSFLMKTPVFVVEHGSLGVLGAASWHVSR